MIWKILVIIALVLSMWNFAFNQIISKLTVSLAEAVFGEGDDDL